MEAPEYEPCSPRHGSLPNSAKPESDVVSVGVPFSSLISECIADHQIRRFFVRFVGDHCLMARFSSTRFSSTRPQLFAASGHRRIGCAIFR
jgi:hypothetical protein